MKRQRVSLKRQQGIVVVITTIALLALLSMAALALEGAHVLLNKSRLQNAVDAAALSAAKTYDQTRNAADSTTAARLTFRQNLQQAGSSELTSVDTLDSLVSDAGGHWRIQYLSSLNPLTVQANPAAPTAPILFVRVTLRNVTLNSFLGQIVGLGEFNVAASAVAGPSPALDNNVCNLTPVVVCARAPDVTENSFFGFQPGTIQELKIGSTGETPLGSGNYQLLDLVGGGGAGVRELMAGAPTGCYDDGDAPNVDTEPGNKVGPVAQGFNTRFGIYQGGVSTTYLPDLVRVNPDVAQTRFGYDAYPNPGTPYRYTDYLNDLSACQANPGGARCNPAGVAQRRVITVVMGDCDSEDNGVAQVPVLGFGCFFLPQSVRHQGNDASIWGEFVRGCNNATGGFSGVPPGSLNNAAPTRIILYKDPESRDA